MKLHMVVLLAVVNAFMCQPLDSCGGEGEPVCSAEDLLERKEAKTTHLLQMGIKQHDETEAISEKSQGPKKGKADCRSYSCPSGTLNTWVLERPFNQQRCCQDVHCQNGVAAKGVCCADTCGTCGGADCQNRPGGSAACCKDPIKVSGVFCESPGDIKCLIPLIPATPQPTPQPTSLPTPQPTPTPTVICNSYTESTECGDQDTCRWKNGNCVEADCRYYPCPPGTLNTWILAGPFNQQRCCQNVHCKKGVAAKGVCCAAKCGTCGGANCQNRPGGNAACCKDPIKDSEVFCESPNDMKCLIPEDS